MSGLQKLCKIYGSLKCGSVLWVWDYHKDEAVHSNKLKPGSAAWKRSEKARWNMAQKLP